MDKGECLINWPEDLNVLVVSENHTSLVDNFTKVPIYKINSFVEYGIYNYS